MAVIIMLTLAYITIGIFAVAQQVLVSEERDFELALARSVFWPVVAIKGLIKVIRS